MAAPIHLLCIDDDAQSLQVRKVLLESYGFQVRTAASGPEGLRAVRSRLADAVVVDYQMPGMDGGEVARGIKSWDPTMPVVVLSALPWLPDDAPRECVDAFVSKSEPLATLVSVVTRLVEDRGRRTPRSGRRWPSRAARIAASAAGLMAGAFVGYSQHKFHTGQISKALSRSAMA